MRSCRHWPDRFTLKTSGLSHSRWTTDLGHVTSQVRLSEGPHTIEYAGYAYKIGWRRGRTELDLKAGRKYRIKLEFCRIFWCQPQSYSAAVWIEDTTSGKVLHGSKSKIPGHSDSYYGLAQTEAEVRASDPALKSLQREHILAEAGEPWAQYRQAFRASDVMEKRRLFCLAALSGHAGAAAQLGYIYRLGLDGFSQDRMEAFKWYALADKIGWQGAKVPLARLADYLTPGEMEEAEQAVAELQVDNCNS